MIWDWLRLVAFVEAAMIWGLTLEIFRLYHRRYRYAVSVGTAGRREGGDRRKGRRSKPRAFDTPWIGLVPRYVWLISVATLILVASECSLVIRGIGHPPEWYGLPTALAGFTLFVVGLTSLARYEYRMVA